MEKGFRKFNATRQQWKAKLPNVAFAEGTEYFLDNREVSVYIYLQFMSAIGDDENTVTSHKNIMSSHLPFLKTKKRNKVEISRILKSLADKCYITVVDGDFLEITINNKMKDEACVVDVDFKDNPMTFKGYTELTVGDYNKACSFTEGLKVYSYVKWRANAQFEYRVSQKEWAVALGKSEKQAFNIVDECVSVGLINKVSGEFKANGQQATNLYTIPTGFEAEMNDVVAEDNIDDVPGGAPEMDIEKEMNTYIKNGIELEQIQAEDSRVTAETYKRFKYKPETADDNLTVDDFKAWKKTTSAVFKQIGTNKFNSIKNGDYIKEKLEEEYKQKYEVEVVKNDYEQEDVGDIFDDSTVSSGRINEEDYLDDIDVEAEVKAIMG